MSSYENLGPEHDKGPSEEQIRRMLKHATVVQPPATVREMVDDLRYLFLMVEFGIILYIVHQGGVFWDDFTAGKKFDSCLDAVSLVILTFLFLGTLGRSHKYRTWLDDTKPTVKK